MYQCKTCTRSKPESEFYMLRPGKPDKSCKGCKAIQKAAKQIATKQPNTKQTEIAA